MVSIFILLLVAGLLVGVWRWERIVSIYQRWQRDKYYVWLIDNATEITVQHKETGYGIWTAIHEEKRRRLSNTMNQINDPTSHNEIKRTRIKEFYEQEDKDA